MNNIPFLDLKKPYLELSQEIDSAIKQVSSGGWYIGGEFLTKFENEFANFTESKYCVGVGNGLDALALSLKALNIGEGDEVIVPAHTFIATYLAIFNVGATPIPVECGEDFLINTDKINQAITPETKAIVAVHLYGSVCDIDSIINIAKYNNLYVIDDSAQAHGAKYKNKRIGSLCDVSCWSFYPGKNLGAMGDGGAITTNNKGIADKIRCIANYGSKKKYHHIEVGVNSRLDPIQASILSVKLKHLDDWNQRRSELAKLYIEQLSDYESDSFKLPKITDEYSSNPVWHLFVIQVKERDKIQKMLKDKGVDTQIHYPHLCVDHDCFPNMKEKYNDKFITERNWCNEILSLPISPHHSIDDITYVTDSLKSIIL